MATTRIPQVPPGQPRRSAIFLARSSDGLAFVPDVTPVISEPDRWVADPAFVRLGDGRYRIYHNVVEGPEPFTPERNQLASGILSRR